jgi:hypothetical protein
MLDLVVDRRELKSTIAGALRFMGATPARIPDPPTDAPKPTPPP